MVVMPPGKKLPDLERAKKCVAHNMTGMAATNTMALGGQVHPRDHRVSALSEIRAWDSCYQSA
jgi:hypothetical protein